MCQVVDCPKKIRARGLCETHYSRKLTLGTTDLPARLDKRCSVGGCDRSHSARGLCGLHYSRLLKAGDVGAAGISKFTSRLPSDDVEGRILERCVTTESECIEWQGYALPSGYGIIHWRGRTWVVHRAMWTVKRGDIPTDDDWTVDHLCRNRRCVNVEHLEVVTRTENAIRGGGLAIAQGRNKQRAAMACKRGHKRTSENSYKSPTSNNWVCRVCKREAWMRQSERVNSKRRAVYREARESGASVTEAQVAASKALTSHIARDCELRHEGEQ